MTGLKVLGCVALGALLTLVILWPTIRDSRREQRWGLLLAPEDVKATCGKPQADDIYTLTYVEGDRTVRLQFFQTNHRMFLQNVHWASSKGSGEIKQVTLSQIDQYVRNGWVPPCLGFAAQ
jgi:hypothetical protein